MDKQTLSNYGLLTVVTLILAVMLAFATPFGTYVGDGVVSVANGFVGASDKSMNKDNISNLGQQWEDKLASRLITLTAKTWNGLTSFRAEYVWTDGTNYYYSDGSMQYILNGDTWEPKTWNGLTNFYGHFIWTDGTSYYYSNGAEQYVFS